MKNRIKSVFATVIATMTRIFQPGLLMANEGTGAPASSQGITTESFDFKSMVYALLGVGADATPEMVNERYKAAMAVEPDGDEAANQKAAEEFAREVEKNKSDLAAATQRVKNLELQVANEIEAKSTLQTSLDKANAELAKAQEAGTKATQLFANERKARTKEVLDAAITRGAITVAERPALETEMANESTFDATLAKVAGKGAALPASGIPAGAVGQRREQHGVVGPRERIAAVGAEVEKVMANEKLDYSKAFAKVQKDRPDLFKDMQQPAVVTAASGVAK